MEKFFNIGGCVRLFEVLIAEAFKPSTLPTYSYSLVTRVKISQERSS